MAKKEAVCSLPNLDRFLEGRERHLVSYAEGANLYSLSYGTFVKLAKAAKANLKMGKSVIVDIDRIEKYLKENVEEAMYYDSLREV